MNEEPEIEYPCPSCGFLMFNEPPGSYGICSICGWEDDHVQLRFPAMGGGANKEGLYESQQIWIEKIPLEVQEYKECKRDKDWRPLKPEECSTATPTTGQKYFDAAAEESPPYYWQK